MMAYAHALNGSVISQHTAQHGIGNVSLWLGDGDTRLLYELLWAFFIFILGIAWHHLGTSRGRKI
jgi:hypothetical protein